MKKLILLFISIMISYIQYANANDNIGLEHSFSTKDVVKKIKQSFNIKDTDKNKKINSRQDEDEKLKENFHDNIIRLKINGMLDGQYSYTNQQKIYENNILPNGMIHSPTLINQGSALNDNNHINARTRIDINPEFENIVSKIKAGAFIRVPIHILSGNIDTDTDHKTASQEYIYFETKYTRFELGSTFSAASKMRVDPQKISSGTGGVYGDWWRYAQMPVFGTASLGAIDAGALNGMSPVFMLYPTLPNESGFTVQRFSTGMIDSNNFIAGDMIYRNNGQAYPVQGARSNKVSIYTKRFYGLQAGFSYSPTTENTGFMTNRNNTYSSIIGGFATDLINFGLNYKKQFGNFGLALSITQEFAKMNSVHYHYGSNTINLSGSPYMIREDIQATAYGMQMTYNNFAISYAYNDWYDSLSNPISIGNAGAYLNGTGKSHSYSHTAGWGFNYGPASFSMHYMHSNYTGNIIDAISIGTDIKILAIKNLSVQPYVELTQFWMKPHGIYLKIGDGSLYEALHNKGQVFMMGVRINF